MGFLNYNITFDIDISNYETDYTKIPHDFLSRGVVLESRFKPYQGYSGNLKFAPLAPVHSDGYFGMDGLCQIKCR
jgi:hypothetical protein